MAEIKGPAIDSEVFRVEGHCCGIRIPALQDPDSDGLRIEFSPENRAAVLEAGMQPAENPQQSAQKNVVPEPRQLSSFFASSSDGTLPLNLTTPSTTSAGVNITPKSG